MDVTEKALYEGIAQALAGQPRGGYFAGDAERTSKPTASVWCGSLSAMGSDGPCTKNRRCRTLWTANLAQVAAGDDHRDRADGQCRRARVKMLK